MPSAEHPAHSFDQYPRSIWRDRGFKDLTAVECKLLFYCFGRRNWKTNTVPLVGISEIAPIIGTNRHRLVDAIRSLTFKGYFDCKKVGRKYSIKVVFSDRGAKALVSPFERPEDEENGRVQQQLTP